MSEKTSKKNVAEAEAATVESPLPSYSKIHIESDDGRAYDLGFNRAMVKRMERNGFDVSRMDSAPITSIESLVIGAFKSFQPMMTEEAIIEVWEQLDGKEELVTALATLYGACTLSLVGNPTGPSRMKWSLV